MRHVVLNDIPFDPDVDTLAKELHVRPGSKRMAHLHELLDRGRAIARPRAIYRVVRVEAKGEDYVVVEGTRLTSRVLRVNLGAAHRAFAYIATCGVELGEWARSMESTLDRYEAEVVAGMALAAARQAIARQLEQRYRPGRLGEMNPGSLPDWPLREQRPLFALLGDPEATIGVQLLSSYLMSPSKTTSGLLFPAEDGYSNCRLCPMEGCPGRKAAYDPDLYERKYRPG
jgi:hypothetical protein